MLKFSAMIPAFVVALAVLQAAAPTTPAQQAFAEGNRLALQSKFAEAIVQFDRAIALDGKNAEMHLAKCRALAGEDKREDAITACTEAVQLDPKNEEAIRDRGHYHLNLGQIDAGLADLTKAQALAPNDRAVYYHLGVGYFIKGDFAHSADNFQKCLDNSKGDDTIECMAWLYPALVRANRKPAATAMLAKVPKDGTVKGHPAWYLDRLLLFKGEKSEAAVAANLNKEGDLSQSSIGYSLGLWHLLNNRKEKARDYFKKAVAVKNTAAWGYRCAEAELQRMK